MARSDRQFGRLTSSLALATMASSSLLGCQIIGGFESFDAEHDSAASPTCQNQQDPGLHGPPMMQWQKPDGSCFWIDSSEVTVAQYREFLEAAPALLTPDACSWNDPQQVESECDPISGGDDLPVRCVDWCDAQAFCAWSGKALCADSIQVGEADSVAVSDWYAACSNNGESSYPYGPSYEANACATRASLNGCDAGSCEPAEVGAYSDCVTSAGMKHSVDLLGNVAEWTDACSPATAEGNCTTRGGSFDSTAPSCELTAPLRRDRARPDVGFRCCAPSP